MAVWQAYISPASLGFPLSVPAACGLYGFLHLKQPILFYKHYIIIIQICKEFFYF